LDNHPESMRMILNFIGKEFKKAVGYEQVFFNVRKKLTPVESLLGMNLLDSGLFRSIGNQGFHSNVVFFNLGMKRGPGHAQQPGRLSPVPVGGHQRFRNYDA